MWSVDVHYVGVCFVYVCVTLCYILLLLPFCVCCVQASAATEQGFEKLEQKVKARAATNLAFLYSLEGDAANAQRYADLAVSTDKYSAQALVNKVCVSQLHPKRRLFC